RDVAARLVHVHVVFGGDDDGHSREPCRKTPVEIRGLEVGMDDRRLESADDADQPREGERMAHAPITAEAENGDAGGVRFGRERTALDEAADRVLEARRCEMCGG